MQFRQKCPTTRLRRPVLTKDIGATCSSDWETTGDTILILVSCVSFFLSFYLCLSLCWVFHPATKKGREESPTPLPLYLAGFQLLKHAVSRTACRVRRAAPCQVGAGSRLRRVRFCQRSTPAVILRRQFVARIPLPL
jgi:hypothetical protein